MYYQKHYKVTALRLDVAKILSLPLGGLLFLVVANWLFRFETISPQQLFIFGALINAVVSVAHLPEALIFTRGREEELLYVNTEYREYAHKTSKRLTRLSLIGMVLIWIAGILLAATLFAYLYGNPVFGVDSQEIIRVMLSQLSLPDQLSAGQVLEIAIKAICLYISLALSNLLSIPLRWVSGKGTANYGRGRVTL